MRMTCDPPLLSRRRRSVRAELPPRTARKSYRRRLEENKQVVLALANALISYSLQTLNGSEIDQVISERLARQAMIAEQERRPKWREVAERAAKISPVTE